MPAEWIPFGRDQILPAWSSAAFEAVPGRTVQVEPPKEGRTLVGRAVLPKLAEGKIAARKGVGALVVRRPSAPGKISPAGSLIVPAVPSLPVSVAADGSFRAENVPPGVYELLIEMEPDANGRELAWLEQVVTVPESPDRRGRPVALGTLVLNANSNGLKPYDARHAGALQHTILVERDQRMIRR